MTKEQLEQAIIIHEKWIESSGTEGARLYAVGWDLSGADLSGRDLSFAVLDEANAYSGNFRRSRSYARKTIKEKEKTMKAYKGFDKDLKCRGFQYEIGKKYHEDKASLCEKGFHACENPIDCFEYYAPGTSRYCWVEINDNGERHDLDTKVCGKKIKIGAELCIGDIIQAAFSFVKERCMNKKKCGHYSALQGRCYSALQGGYCSALQGGYYSALQGGHRSALQGGDRSALQGGHYSALQGGHYSALQGGDCSALQGGDCSALQGGARSALQGGYYSALQGGEFSVLYGGECAKVRGGLYSVLALQYWIDNRFIDVKAKVVDGKNILPNVWYRLDSRGRFVKAGDENCE